MSITPKQSLSCDFQVCSCSSASRRTSIGRNKLSDSNVIYQLGGIIGFRVGQPT